MRTSVLVSSLVALLGLATPAQAKEGRQHRYVGEHPTASGDFCYIHAPHVHVYAPVKAEVLYRDHDGWNHFVGDPVAFGYEGPRHAYQGAHPIHVEVAIGEPHDHDAAPEYCYVKGPHYHISAPPPEARFEVRGDVHFYVGDFEPRFHAERARRARINVVLEPMVYVRPVVVVGPPPGWVDVLVDVRPAASVHAGVEVHVPAPVIDVSFGIGVVPVVVDHHHHERGRGHKHGHKKHKKHKGRW